jgi:hypothetical protein
MTAPTQPATVGMIQMYMDHEDICKRLGHAPRMALAQGRHDVPNLDQKHRLRTTDAEPDR